jgi:uncharacterized LabA/DUF88 family protein
MKSLNIALFVDVENYKEPQNLFTQFLDGLSDYGNVISKVAIGDWVHNKNLENWKPVCNEQKIIMEGYMGFKGKNAADRAIVAEATKLIKSQTANAIAIYSRDMGFAIGIAALKVIGATVIVPKMEKEYIPDANHYIMIDRTKLLVSQATTELGMKLLKAMPQLFY